MQAPKPQLAAEAEALEPLASSAETIPLAARMAAEARVEPALPLERFEEEALQEKYAQGKGSPAPRADGQRPVSSEAGEPAMRTDIEAEGAPINPAVHRTDTMEIHSVKQYEAATQRVR